MEGSASHGKQMPTSALSSPAGGSVKLAECSDEENVVAAAAAAAPAGVAVVVCEFRTVQLSAEWLNESLTVTKEAGGEEDARS